MPKVEEFPEPGIYTAYGLYLLTSQHRLIRNLKKVYAPSVHGHKTWRSSFLLMDYLREKPIRKGARVMEVGCGWGPASIFCAKEFKAKVTGVDIDDEVFPYMDVLAELNDVKVKSKKATFQSLSAKQLGTMDLIVGSDICFWNKLVDPLQKMIGRAFKGGAKRVIITDPGRPTFYELADKCAKKFDATLSEWYALEPNRSTGEVLDIRPG